MTHDQPQGFLNLKEYKIPEPKVYENFGAICSLLYTQINPYRTACITYITKGIVNAEI